MILKVKKLHPDAIVPKYAHEGDAGLDLFSIEDLEISPGEKKLISTGISIEIPKNYVGLVWDKSGMAANHNLHTLAGVIDSGYRGEVKIVLMNLGKESKQIEKSQKIAQLLIQPIETAGIQEVLELSDTSRGEGGFGSSGLK